MHSVAEKNKFQVINLGQDGNNLIILWFGRRNWVDQRKMRVLSQRVSSTPKEFVRSILTEMSRFAERPLEKW